MARLLVLLTAWQMAFNAISFDFFCGPKTMVKWSVVQPTSMLDRQTRLVVELIFWSMLSSGTLLVTKTFAAWANPNNCVTCLYVAVTSQSSKIKQRTVFMFVKFAASWNTIQLGVPIINCAFPIVELLNLSAIISTMICGAISRTKRYAVMVSCTDRQNIMAWIPGMVLACIMLHNFITHA